MSALDWVYRVYTFTFHLFHRLDTNITYACNGENMNNFFSLSIAAIHATRTFSIIVNGNMVNVMKPVHSIHFRYACWLIFFSLFFSFRHRFAASFLFRRSIQPFRTVCMCVSWDRSHTVHISHRCRWLHVEAISYNLSRKIQFSNWKVQIPLNCVTWHKTTIYINCYLWFISISYAYHYISWSFTIMLPFHHSSSD